jgi:quercetin dioxygenase-like cupin family protein
MSSTVQQAPGLWRTDLQQHDLSIPGREVIQNRVEIGAEAPLVKHKHPGEEIIYVLEGSLEYQLEGQPPETYHAGDALIVPAGTDSVVTFIAVRELSAGRSARERAARRRGPPQG